MPGSRTWSSRRSTTCSNGPGPGPTCAWWPRSRQTTPLGIHARGDVESLADLAGCRFAVDAPDNGFALIAKRLLRDAGVEVDYVVVGGVRERLDALLGGQVDATLLGPPFDKLAEKAGFAARGGCQRPAAGTAGPRPGGPRRASRFRGAGTLPRAPWCAGWRPESRWPTRRASSCLNAAATRPRPRAPGARAPARLRWISADLELLTGIRRSLGMLPPDIGLEELCDGEPLLRATRSATVGN